MSKEYLNFSKKTTQYLKENNNLQKYLFIRLLSPIREDIDFNYIKKFNIDSNIFSFLINNFFILAFNYLVILKVTFLNLKAFWVNNKKYKSIVSSRLNQKCKVGFITHCDIFGQIQSKHDSYFGLKRNSNEYQFIILNKTSIKGKNLEKRINELNLFNCYFIDLFGTIEIFVECLYQSFKSHLSLLLKSLYYPKHKFIFAAAIDALSFSSITNLIIYKSVKKILNKSKITKLIMTWEGHPWERYITKFCSSKNINIYGYIHAGPFKTQYSAHRYLGNEYKPKFLLSPTLISQKLLKLYFSQKSIVIGSYKSRMINKYKKLLNSKNLNSSKKSKSLLLIPSGTVKDVKNLLQIACAIQSEELTIRIRLHPGIQRNKNLIDHIYKNINNTNNKKKIIFSRISLNKDIQLTTHFLYTGSTASLECLAGGLTPIHLNRENELDSLEGYNIPSKFEAYSANDVKKILNYKISPKFTKKVISYHEKSFDYYFIKNHIKKNF